MGKSKTLLQRLKNLSNVTFVQAALPHQMPEGLFDLIVASDVLYYLPKDVLFESLDCIETGLMPNGHLFALHYLGDFGQPMRGRDVHDLMKKYLKLEIIHDETMFGEGPKAENGYTITIFKKPEMPGL